jgi:hypothetical protein
VSLFMAMGVCHGEIRPRAIRFAFQTSRHRINIETTGVHVDFSAINPVGQDKVAYFRVQVSPAMLCLQLHVSCICSLLTCSQSACPCLGLLSRTNYWDVRRIWGVLRHHYKFFYIPLTYLFSIPEDERGDMTQTFVFQSAVRFVYGV